MKQTPTSSHANLCRAALVFAVAGCAMHTELEAQASEYVGCYDVHLGTWSPGPLPSDSIHYLPPTRVQLKEQPGQGIDGRPRGNAVDPAPSAMPSIHSYSWWDIVGDSIHLVWTTGFAGISARVAAGDNLSGEARRFVDVVPSTQFTVPINLAPIDCEAPVPVERRRSYRFSPVVRLTSGEAIVLDSLPDQGLNVERLTERSFLVHSEPLAPYDAADRVEVWLHADGTVRAVRLRFPNEVQFEAAVSTLRDRFGEPTGARDSPRWTTWSSRLMYISVTESNGHVQVSVVSQRRL